MHRPTRLKLSDLNPHFMCVLCDGYLVDATTIIECLHSFCRTCIVRYLENSRFCPVCDVQVHKTKPLQSIRSDKTLQDIVYKLVPGLYQNEMKRRKELYAEHPEAAASCSPEDRGEGADQRFIYAPDETISLSLEYIHETNEDPLDSPEDKSSESDKKEPQKRYLQCPAAISVAHLKKFITMKFGLPTSFTVEIIHRDDVMSDDYTLMDIAYIYAWKRAGPMRFFYNITKRVIKRLRTVSVAQKTQVPSISEEPVVTENSISGDVSEKTFEPKEKIQKLDIEQKSSDGSTSCRPVESGQKDDSASNLQATNLHATPMAAAESSKPESHKPIPASEAAAPTVNSSLNKTVTATNSTSLPCNVSKMVESSGPMVIPTTNGVTLKFVQRPPLEELAKGRSKKTTGKRTGRTSRYKGNVVTRAPLVRLAPYPPPGSAPPVTHLTTAPMTHLAPITVRNLVPSTMTGLPPSLVTTLRAPTVNTLCNSTINSIVPNASQLVATHAPYRAYQTHPSPNFIPQTVNSTTVVTTRFPSIAPSGQFMTTTETSTALRPCIPESTLTNSQKGHPLPPTNMSNPVSVEKTQTQLHTEAQIKPITVQANGNLLLSSGITIASTIPSSQPSELIKISTAPMGVTVTPPVAVSTATPSVPIAIASALPVTVNSAIPPVTVPCTVRLCPKAVPSILKDNQKELDGKVENDVCAVPVSKSVTPLDTKTPPPVNSFPKISITVPTSSASEQKCNSLSNGVKSPQVKSPLKDHIPFRGSFTIEKKSEDFPFKITVKNTISAEFSDNDDLGCQPDLVVDEQKLDSSDNEDDDADDALRKKITAIAEKEDEADVTDDTEADSGRASDISSQARSSCDDDVGSPMMSAADTVTCTAVTSTSTSSSTFSPRLPPFTSPVHTTSSVSVTTSSAEDGHRSSKSIGLDHVISNLYRNRNHEKKDTFGALDLSTSCTRKPGEEAPRSRQKAVANPPVLDVKHRQQTCLSAPPSKQHTACVPSPKHPTSTTLHLAGMAAAHHAMLPSASPHHKSLPIPVPYSTMAYPCQNRANSSPTVIGRSTPTFGMNVGMLAPTAHQNLPPLVPPGPSHQCMGGPMISTFQGWTPVPPGSMGIQGRSTPTSTNVKRNDSSPTPNCHSSQQTHVSVTKLMPTSSKPTCTSSSGSVQNRKSASNSDLYQQHVKSPSSRNGSSAMASPTSHHKPAPNVARSSPNPTSSPSPVTVSSSKPAVSSSSSPVSTTLPSSPLVNNVTPSSSSTTTSSTPTYKLSQPSIPIYKKSSNSYKNHGHRFKGSNLTVFNPDPNGFRQKIVIKNLDFRPNNHQPQRL